MDNVSVKKNLYKLTMPIFIDIALVMLLGAVDTVMLSRYSDDAVAAVGLDNQLISFVFLVYQFVSMGAAILCAQYFGAGYRTRFMQIVRTAWLDSELRTLAMGRTDTCRFRTERSTHGRRSKLSENSRLVVVLSGYLAHVQCRAAFYWKDNKAHDVNCGGQYPEYPWQLCLDIRTLGTACHGS